MDLIFAVSSVMLASWVLWALVRGPLSKIIGFRICAICAAVSGTWVLIWLARSLTSLRLDPLIPAILMGESITGLMYLYERWAKKHEYHGLLMLRIIILIAGTIVAYMLVSRIY